MDMATVLRWPATTSPRGGVTLTVRRKAATRDTRPHLSDNKHLLLDPRFLIQIAAILLSVAGFAWSVRSDVQSLAKDQAATNRTVEEIKTRLPNNEALGLRLAQIEEDVVALRGQVAAFDSWVRITREQLAAKGFKP